MVYNKCFKIVPKKLAIFKRINRFFVCCAIEMISPNLGILQIYYGFFHRFVEELHRPLDIIHLKRVIVCYEKDKRFFAFSPGSACLLPC